MGAGIGTLGRPLGAEMRGTDRPLGVGAGVGTAGRPDGAGVGRPGEAGTGLLGALV